MNLNNLTDKGLVEMLAYGDEAAFCELYARHRNRLKMFCCRYVKSEDIAENYVQDVFMKIWENRTMLDPEKSFSSFIYTIAKHEMLNYLRRASMNDTTCKKFMQNYMISTTQGCEQEFIENDYMEALQAAVKNLSPQQQKVFRLSRNDHLTHKEIAQTLGLSVYTVQEYISIAMKSIKKYIERNTDMVFIFGFIINMFTLNQ